MSPKEQFDELGYCVVRGFLDPEELEAVTTRLEHHIRTAVPQLPPEDRYCENPSKPETLKQLPRLEEHEPFFATAAFRNRQSALAESLLGLKVTPQGLQYFDKPPGVGQATPPHQDGYFFMLDRDEAVTMWLALDHVDESNGCVRYVPRSHGYGMRAHARTDVTGFSQAIPDYADHDKEVPISARPGDLLVHHSLTIHRADPNRSDRHRRALGSNYYSARARRDDARYKAYQQSLNESLEKAGKI